MNLHSKSCPHECDGCHPDKTDIEIKLSYFINHKCLLCGDTIHDKSYVVCNECKSVWWEISLGDRSELVHKLRDMRNSL